MVQKFIPLSVPNLKGNELKYVTEAVETEWVSSGGSFITEFESKFSEYIKSSAVALQSGTSALHLAYLQADIKPGDLVICPTLTFIAAVNPIKYLGADPVFIDCDDELCLDPIKLNEYLKNDCKYINGQLLDIELNKPVKAICVVHIFGNGADMESIMDIAEKYNLPVIEDATEAVGTFYTKGKYSGKMCGTIGDFGAYSFNGNKIITTGGGGMLTANNQENLKITKYLSTQAKDDEVYFVHNEVGYNYRMTNLQAALGIAQLEQLDKFIENKKSSYELYKQLGLKLLPFSRKVSPNYWFFSYITKHRDKIISYLKENNIQARPIWKLNHIQKPYLNCKAYKIEKASQFYDTIVNIPCSTNLTDKDVEYVEKKINEFECMKKQKPTN